MLECEGVSGQPPTIEHVCKKTERNQEQTQDLFDLQRAIHLPTQNEQGWQQQDTRKSRSRGKHTYHARSPPPLALSGIETCHRQDNEQGFSHRNGEKITCRKRRQ